MIGANLDAVKDWVRSPFVNILKSARVPGLITKPESALGGNEYPPGDFGMVVWTDAAHAAGNYVLTGTGNLRALTFPWKGGEILESEIVPGERFRIKIKYTNKSQFALGFVGSNWGNLDLRYEQNESLTQVFAPWFMDLCVSLDPDFFRFMDWAQANNSEQKSFEEFTRVEQPTWRQVPWLIQLMLCVEVGKRTGRQPDAWINVPLYWGQSDFEKLARVVAEYTDFEGYVYPGYSNELWNGQFKQFAWNRTLAIADPLFGDLTNIEYRPRARAVYMMCLMAQVFHEILPGRTRGVIEGHAGDAGKHRIGISWMKSRFPEMLTGIYGLAIAPYYGDINKDFFHRDDLTLDEIFQHLMKQVVLRDARPESGTETSKAFLDAKQNGWVPLAYEWGPDFGAAILMEPDPDNPGKMRKVLVNGKVVTPSQDVKIAAKKDPRIRESLRWMFENWFQNGGGPLGIFVLHSVYERFQWGFTWDPLDAPAFVEAREMGIKYKEKPAMAKVDAVGVRLDSGVKFPLNAPIRGDGWTIEFTADKAVTSFRLQVYRGTELLHAIVEKQKPYRLAGDSTAWNFGRGEFKVVAIAYDRDVEIGRMEFPLQVGLSAEELEQQVADLQRLKGVMEGQIHDLESELVGVRSSLDKLKADITRILQS
jgi:hypothetical protein